MCDDYYNLFFILWDFIKVLLRKIFKCIDICRNNIFLIFIYVLFNLYYIGFDEIYFEGICGKMFLFVN